MKILSTCIIALAFFLFAPIYLNAQVNANDSLALINLFDSTKGKKWTVHTNWKTTQPVSTWYGITVTNGRVTVVNLYNNNLDGKIPVSFGNLNKVQYVYLSINKLSGSIPSSIGNLSSVVYLDLFSNQLSGSIPSSIGNLTKLTNLYLSSNQLTGKIPPTLGNLVNLTDFLLGVNQLSGKIPSSFNKFKHLTQRLGLARNNLSGKIPKLDSIPSGAVINLFTNKFTFSGLEHLVQTHSNVAYTPQANIKLNRNGNIFSVNAGGTLSNNTYYWYFNNFLIATHTGTDTFISRGAGTYYAIVGNAIASNLYLYSDTVSVSPDATDENIIFKANAQTLLYPNPANKVIHLQLKQAAHENTIAVMFSNDGKKVLQQKIFAGSSTIDLKVANLSNGNYVLVLFENGIKVNEQHFIVAH